MPISLPLVSIIILNYNGRKFLHPCLSSLAQLNYPPEKIETIVIDNHSSDDSVSYLKRAFPEVTLFKSDQNLGFAKGNNLGAQMAGGEYLAFLNNDTKVDPNWLIAIIEMMRRDQPIFAGGSLVLNIDQPTQIHSYGSKLLPLGEAFHPEIGLNLNQVRLPTTRQVLAPLGASMVVEKKMFHQVGRFDEDFFMYCDETDLCLRAWKMGLPSLVTKSSILFHRIGHGLFSPFQAYYSAKNRPALILKNFNLRRLAIGLFSSGSYSLYQTSQSLLRGDLPLAVSGIRGSLASLRELSQNWRKRKIIQPLFKRSDYHLPKNIWGTYGQARKVYSRRIHQLQIEH